MSVALTSVGPLWVHSRSRYEFEKGTLPLLTCRLLTRKPIYLRMKEEKLVRGLGRWDLTAMGVNTIIGTGIFLLPSKIMDLVGSYSIFAFIACAVVVGFIVLCFAEVSSRFQTTGGMYLYAREAFGKTVGFETGWLYWITRIAVFAAVCNAFLIYLGFFAPGVNEGWLRIGIICAIVTAVTSINLLGIRQSAITTNIFTIGKIVPLLTFVAIGAFFVHPSNFSFGEVPPTSKFSEVILLLIYTLGGFETAVIPAGETKDPRKNVPFALLTAIAVCAVLFILVQIVAIGTLPDLAKSERPLADAATAFMGSYGAGFIVVGALISIFGHLNGGFLAASRLPFAMAEQKDLPEIIARTHPRFKTPTWSILITAAFALFLTIQSSFLTAVTISTIARLLVYATTCGALPLFRFRKAAPKAEFTAPFGIAASIFSLGLIVWLLTNVDYAKEGLAVIVTIAIGLVIFAGSRFFGRTKESLPPIHE